MESPRGWTLPRWWWWVHQCRVWTSGEGPRAPCSDSLREWTADPVLIVFLLSEYKFSARWTKVMGTAEWKASRTRRW